MKAFRRYQGSCTKNHAAADQEQEDSDKFLIFVPSLISFTFSISKWCEPGTVTPLCKCVLGRAPPPNKTLPVILTFFYESAVPTYQPAFPEEKESVRKHLFSKDPVIRKNKQQNDCWWLYQLACPLLLFFSIDFKEFVRKARFHLRTIFFMLRKMCQFSDFTGFPDL